MNKKAFTLVELLAIIIVLGLILTIVVPKIFSTIQKSKEDVYKVKENQMKKAAEDYTLYKNITMPNSIGDTININLTELINAKLVNQIKDLNDDSICQGFVLVTKTNSQNYSYTPCLMCNTYSTNNSSCN